MLAALLCTVSDPYTLFADAMPAVQMSHVRRRVYRPASMHCSARMRLPTHVMLLVCALAVLVGQVSFGVHAERAACRTVLAVAASDSALWQLIAVNSIELTESASLC
jgi:hypothetical protein